MKRKMIVAGIATLGLAATITACGDKNKKNPTPTLTKAEYLKAKVGWVIDKSYEIKNSQETDITWQWAPCEKDDRYFFKDGGVLTIDEGAAKCKESSPQSVDYSYALIANDTKIVMRGDTFDIVTLNATTLSFKASYISNNVPKTVRHEFKH